MEGKNYKLEKYVFSFSDNKVIKNPLFEEQNFGYISDDYVEDTYDYERDTYYALGGTDYDAFKERGGDIDDMMDRMGF